MDLVWLPGFWRHRDGAFGADALDPRHDREGVLWFGDGSSVIDGKGWVVRLYRAAARIHV